MYQIRIYCTNESNIKINLIGSFKFGHMPRAGEWLKIAASDSNLEKNEVYQFIKIIHTPNERYIEALVEVVSGDCYMMLFWN